MCPTHVLAILACFIFLLLPFTSALAPLEGMDVEERYPNEYIVTLHKDHTLAQHFHNINRDLSAAPGFREYAFGYEAVMDGETLDAVRRDGGVRAVEGNRPVHAILPEDVEIMETPQWLKDQYPDVEV